MDTSPARTGALYIRVSTHSQEELSPDAQKRLLLEYAAQNNIIVSNEYIYEEDGISGRKADKRPKFQDMIAHAKSKEHPFDVILVWKFSRFARNQEESIVYKSMLKRDNVDVISISEPLVDGPFGSLIERIIEWMDEYYSIRLSGEVFRGMSENALRGNYQARPPLGYRIPHHGEAPVIVPEEAAIVHLIFDMYTEQGKGMFEIAKHLNSLGYQTSHKKPFERRSIDYILRNESYTGKTVWNRHSNADKSIKDESEWIIADGQHEAIISPEQFNKAKTRHAAEYRPKNQRPASTCRHWLSGVMKCAACGRTLSTSVHTDRKYNRVYTNFQCYGVMKGKCTVSQQISEKKLVPQILAGFEQIITSGQIVFRIIDDNNTAADSTLITKRLTEIDRKESRIKQAYRDGIDTIDEYKENKAILAQERTALEEQLAKLNSNKRISKAHAKKVMLDKIRNVYELIQDDTVPMPARNEAIKSVLEKIVFDRQNEILDFYFYLSSSEARLN